MQDPSLLIEIIHVLHDADSIGKESSMIERRNMQRYSSYYHHRLQYRRKRFSHLVIRRSRPRSVSCCDPDLQNIIYIDMTLRDSITEKSAISLIAITF